MEKELLLLINRPQKLCMNCDAAIDVIERHPSVLRALTKRKIERWDYCPDCWTQIKEETWESFWITKRTVKEVKVRKLTRRERSSALRALFESLWERRETEDVGPHIFFLAHLLMKWGGLRWREDRQDILGNEIVVFEDPTTGDAIEINAVPIDEERMNAIKIEVEEFLKQYAAEEQPAL